MKPQSRYIDVDGIRTHYLEAGGGTPIVLLHSGEFGACAELSWEFTIPALSDRWRVIAPDLLGYGQTDKLHDFVSGEARRISHLCRFLKCLDVREATFIGNSMGGSMFARAFSSDPGRFPRVTSIVLMSAGGAVPATDARAALLAYDCTKEGMRAMLRAMLHDPAWVENEVYVERRHRLSLAPGAWECAAAARFKSPATTVVPAVQGDTIKYENITVPVLFIAGANDKLRSSGYAHDIARRIANVELHVIENCGHCPNVEVPVTTNRLIVEFLGRQQSN